MASKASERSASCKLELGGFGARGGIRTLDLPITRRMLGVGQEAPDGPGLLPLAAPSVQTALDGSRGIVWMIIGMIKAHPMENRMPLRLTPPQPRTSCHDRCQSSLCRYTTGLREPPASNLGHWPGCRGSAMLPRWRAFAWRPGTSPAPAGNRPTRSTWMQSWPGSGPWGSAGWPSRRSIQTGSVGSPR